MVLDCKLSLKILMCSRQHCLDIFLAAAIVKIAFFFSFNIIIN